MATSGRVLRRTEGVLVTYGQKEKLTCLVEMEQDQQERAPERGAVWERGKDKAGAAWADLAWGQAEIVYVQAAGSRSRISEARPATR